MVDTTILQDEVFTFDRIVTYKTAGALLGIKTQNTKELLVEYVKKSRIDNKNVTLTYLLGGVNSAGTRSVTIVPEKDYEEAKSNFTSIFLDQIYSVQKSATISWESISNIDDFVYDIKSDVKIEQPEVVEIKSSESVNISNGTEKVTQKVVAKKGSISNFFNQPSAKTSEQKVGKETNKKTGNKTEKTKKSNDIKELFKNAKCKTPEENNSKNANNIKTEVDDGEDEEIFHNTGLRKRCRVLDDEDEEETSIKHPKIDILDENSEESEIECCPDVMSEDEIEVNKSNGETSPSLPTEEMVVDEITEDKPVKKETNEETMYEDADGYFVTEKPKQKNNVKEVPKPPISKEEKKENIDKKKKEKKAKKEVTEKLKKNTNQKTLFNFFKKM